MEFFIGGGGTNTAVGFSRLGFRTAYLGKIGNDENGSRILKCLKDESVAFIGATAKKGYSGYSVILDSVAEDRTIFAYKGSNDQLAAADIDFKKLNAQWFYFSSMMQKSFETQKRIVAHAAARKIKIAFNPSLYIAALGAHHIARILAHTEILIFNKEEAQALLGDTDSNIQNLCMKVAKFGPKIIVITDGRNGAHCYNTHEHLFYIVMPAKVKIIETTGAGDAFSVGFVAGIMNDKPTETALKMGMLNAESVIAHRGAKNILLGKGLFRTAEKDRRKVEKKKI